MGMLLHRTLKKIEEAQKASPVARDEENEKKEVKKTSKKKTAAKAE